MSRSKICWPHLQTEPRGCPGASPSPGANLLSSHDPHSVSLQQQTVVAKDKRLATWLQKLDYHQKSESLRERKLLRLLTFVLSVRSCTWVNWLCSAGSETRTPKKVDIASENQLSFQWVRGKFLLCANSSNTRDQWQTIPGTSCHQPHWIHPSRQIKGQNFERIGIAVPTP